MAVRGGGTTFDRLFSRAEEAADPEKCRITIHELFSSLMRDELKLPMFAEALVNLHGIRLNESAIRLLSSTDAASGRLSFGQFQRALQEGDGSAGPLGGNSLASGAGRPVQFSDQAPAIMQDNSGAAAPPSAPMPSRMQTDISADPFIKAQANVQKRSNAGAFGDNPIVQTNRVSSGNPLAPAPVPSGAFGGGAESSDDDPYGNRQMTKTATQCYIDGELSRMDYEKFIERFGVTLFHESELSRLILSHERAGDGNSMKMWQALQRAIAEVAPSPQDAAPATVSGPAAGGRRPGR